MSNRERAKLVLLKLGSIVFLVLCLLSLSIWDSSLASRLSSAGAAIGTIGFYANLFRVRLEVAELFEPPYDFNGLGAVWLGALFIAGSVWLTLFP